MESAIDLFVCYRLLSSDTDCRALRGSDPGCVWGWVCACVCESLRLYMEVSDCWIIGSKLFMFVNT